MPSEAGAASPQSPSEVRRPAAPARHDSSPSTPSNTSRSPGDALGSNRAGLQKAPRHVVGQHGRLGPRNLSHGRNLNKIIIPPMERSGSEEGAPLSAKANLSGTPLVSPGIRQKMKRTQTSLALPRTSSHTALKKNHSSGQLTRHGGSGKHLSKQARQERSHSHPGKGKLRSPPPAGQKQAAVHFDVGDGADDDGEGMEGVDDVWTEDSASPNTTRDNTTNNTRQNSIILDPERNPHRRTMKKPPDIEPEQDEQDEQDEEPSADPPDSARETEEQDFASTADASTRASSYKANTQLRPLDADAIAKRLIERNHRGHNTTTRAQVSDASALAAAEAADGEAGSAQQVGNGHAALPAGTSGSAPLVSRFINNDSAPGSHDGTPKDPPRMVTRRDHQRRASQQEEDADEAEMKRNKSAPNFAIQQSPVPSDPGSGTTTPGGPFRPSRTQQKLWLQRGLSNIEANSQQHLPSLLPTGRMHRGGAPGRQFAKIEKEYAVVRRFRDPIGEAMERLERLRRIKARKAERAAGETISPQKKTGQGAKSDAKSSSSDKSTTTKQQQQQQQLVTAGTGAGPTRAKVSFALSGPDDEEEDEKPLDWQHMSIDEIEDATLDIRRQMWELQPVAEC